MTELSNWEKNNLSLDEYEEQILRTKLRQYFDPRGKYQRNPEYRWRNPRYTDHVLMRELRKWAGDGATWRNDQRGCYAALEQTIERLKERKFLARGMVGPRGGETVKILVKWNKL